MAIRTGSHGITASSYGSSKAGERSDKRLSEWIERATPQKTARKELSQGFALLIAPPRSGLHQGNSQAPSEKKIKMEHQDQSQSMTQEEIQALLSLSLMERIVALYRREGWSDEEIAEAIRDS